jgi:hypothetical protein
MRLFFARWLELYALFRAADFPELHHQPISSRNPENTGSYYEQFGNQQQQALVENCLPKYEHAIEKAIDILESNSDENIEECLPQLSNMIANMQSKPVALLEGGESSLVVKPSRFTFFRRTRIIRGTSSHDNSQYIRSVSVVSTNPVSLSQSSLLATNIIAPLDHKLGGKNTPPYVSETMARHCLTFMRQSLEAAMIRKCSKNPIIAMKVAWILEDVSVHLFESLFI